MGDPTNRANPASASSAEGGARTAVGVPMSPSCMALTLSASPLICQELRTPTREDTSPRDPRAQPRHRFGRWRPGAASGRLHHRRICPRQGARGTSRDTTRSGRACCGCRHTAVCRRGPKLCCRNHRDRHAATSRDPVRCTSALAEVTRDAKRTDGYLPVWTRDERTWIEIPAALIDQPMFFASSVAGGIGIGGLWPGMMGREHIVSLRRVGNTVQLLARNQHARAPVGSTLARAVAESYSDSLLGAAPWLLRRKPAPTPCWSTLLCCWAVTSPAHRPRWRHCSACPMHLIAATRPSNGFAHSPPACT